MQKPALFCVLFLTAALFSPAQANLILNGSFEDDAFFTTGFFDHDGGNTNITHWIVTLNHIDWVANLWQASHGDYSVDLNGSNCFSSINCDGGIAQTFTTVAGHQYQVSFDLAANLFGDPVLKTARVLAAGQQQDFTFDSTGHTTASMGWVNTTWTFTATSASTTLEFQGLDTTGYGAAIDNVVVEDQGIPEPGSLLLLVPALALLLKRRAR